jgi:hypothetical protein
MQSHAPLPTERQHVLLPSLTAAVFLRHSHLAFQAATSNVCPMQSQGLLQQRDSMCCCLLSLLLFLEAFSPCVPSSDLKCLPNAEPLLLPGWHRLALLPSAAAAAAADKPNDMFLLPGIVTLTRLTLRSKQRPRMSARCRAAAPPKKGVCAAAFCCCSCGNLNDLMLLLASLC